MLKSFDPLFRVNVAKYDFGCAGNGDNQHIRQFSSLCDRAIHVGEEYVETLEIIPSVRLVPRRFYIVSRHCAHCSLTFLRGVEPGPEVEVNRAA